MSRARQRGIGVEIGPGPTGGAGPFLPILFAAPKTHSGPIMMMLRRTPGPARALAASILQPQAAGLHVHCPGFKLSMPHATAPLHAAASWRERLGLIGMVQAALCADPRAGP